MNSFDEFSKALYVAKTCMEVRFYDLKKRRNEMINLINRGRVVVPGSFECVDRYDKELCDLASSIIAIYRHLDFSEVCYEEYLEYLSNSVE